MNFVDKVGRWLQIGLTAVFLITIPYFFWLVSVDPEIELVEATWLSLAALGLAVLSYKIIGAFAGRR